MEKKHSVHISGTPYVIVVVTVQITDAAPPRVINAIGGKPWRITLPILVLCPKGESWDWIPREDQTEAIGRVIVDEVILDNRVLPDFTICDPNKGPTEWFNPTSIDPRIVVNPQDHDEFSVEFGITLETGEGDELAWDSNKTAYWATLSSAGKPCVLITGRVTRVHQAPILALCE